MPDVNAFLHILNICSDTRPKMIYSEKIEILRNNEPWNYSFYAIGAKCVKARVQNEVTRERIIVTFKRQHSIESTGDLPPSILSYMEEDLKHWCKEESLRLLQRSSLIRLKAFEEIPDDSLSHQK